MMDHARDHVTRSELINPRDVEWERVATSKYLVHQKFQYEYPSPISDLRHQLMVIPPTTFGDQQRTVYSLSISEPGEVITKMDELANTVLDVRIPFVERTIEFEAWVNIERTGPAMPRPVPADWLHDPRFLEATPRTASDTAIDRAAAELRASGATGLQLVDLVNFWVYDTMAYVAGVTGIHTTAASALADRRGVCQDYAHLMIAICRRLGLPALYVSGHLLGEGATHAWVEVLLPASEESVNAVGWAFDPTHGQRADLTYLTVAAGRDYGDVAPTSGSYRAGHGGTLTGRKEVRVVEVVYRD